VVHDLRRKQESQHLEAGDNYDEDIFEIMIAFVFKKYSFEDRRHEKHDSVVNEAGRKPGRN